MISELRVAVLAAMVITGLCLAMATWRIATAPVEPVTPVPAPSPQDVQGH